MTTSHLENNQPGNLDLANQHDAGAQAAVSSTANHAERAIQALKPVAVADRVSFVRLVQVEFRKLLDTRAGLWLTGIAFVGAVVAAAGIAVFYRPFARGLGTSWLAPAGLIVFPMALLIPVVVILFFTQEWGQRTTLTTFTLEPRRGRVLAAKGVAAAAISVVSWLAVQALSAASAGIGGAVASVSVDWKFDATRMLGLLASTALTYAMAAGFGLLLMNTAAAIVLYMALPMLVQILVVLGKRAQEVLAWTDLTTAANVLVSQQHIANGWWKLLVASTIWVVIPITIGVIRNLRREAK